LMRDYAGASADYAKVLELDPKNVRAYYQLADLNSLKHDNAAAILDYTKAIELDPKNPFSYSGRGIVEEAAGDHAAAIADFDKALALDPKSTNVYMTRADAKTNKGDREGALTDFDQAVKLDPANALDYVFRGRAKGAFGDYDGAVADYAKAIELEPKTALAYVYRATERYDRQAWKEALEDYRKICVLTPDHQTYARLRIWLIRARTGERAQADAELAEFLASPASHGQEQLAAIGLFLTGKTSAEDFLKSVPAGDAESDRARQVVAYFFAGTKKLIDGDKTAALDLLKKSTATGLKGKQSYRSAAVEAGRLAGAK
jgi:tetratricopeptide (TPR) repeat protein